MTTVPTEVVLDDLAEPRFPPQVAALREQVAQAAPLLVLEPDALMARAAAETGVDDFGDPWFREPLAVLCESARREAGLSPAGTVMMWAQLVGMLKSRLLVEDVVRRHPEVQRVEVRRPIVIAGLPRTGTTHLHNLLSADPALRSLPYWESLEPVLAEADRPARGEPDPRLARTEASLALVNSAMPQFAAMHEMTVDHAHEEIALLALTFSTMFFETLALLPSYRDWYSTTDQRPAYAYLRRVLQVLQWLRGGERWVLKSPQHLEQFGALMATFPDATVVVTHRDPVAVTASLATMTAYTARMYVDRPDVAAIGRYWADRTQDLLEACLRDRDLLPAQRALDVRFSDFMADEWATVERIYAVARQPLPATSRAAMQDFVAAHPRGRHGHIRYDLSTFGLDPAERRAALRPYSERFGVADER